MRVRRLHIEQQMAVTRAETQMASLSIDTAKRRMRIERQSPQMSVAREAGKIELNIQDFYDNIGLKSIQTLIKEAAAKAYVQASDGIKQIVADGNFVGTLPSSGNSIGQLARKKLLQTYEPQMGGEVPYGAIKMEGIAGKIDIDWSKYDIKIVWDQFQTPQIQVEPKASVEVKLIQKPRIKCTVVEEMIPPETGEAVDLET